VSRKYLHHKRAEPSVNTTEHSSVPLGSGNIATILLETAWCHLQWQSSGSAGSGVDGSELRGVLREPRQTRASAWERGHLRLADARICVWRRADSLASIVMISMGSKFPLVHW